MPKEDSISSQKGRRCFESINELEYECKWKDCNFKSNMTSIFQHHIASHLTESLIQQETVNVEVHSKAKAGENGSYVTNFDNANDSQFGGMMKWLESLESSNSTTDQQSKPASNSTCVISPPPSSAVNTVQCGICGAEMPAQLAVCRRHGFYHAMQLQLRTKGAQYSRVHSLPSCHCRPANDCVDFIPALPTPWECAWRNCDYVTDNVCEFYAHVTARHQAVSRCQWADCAFVPRGAYPMKKHLMRHTFEKCVACPACGLGFSAFTKFCDHLKRQIPNIAVQQQQQLEKVLPIPDSSPPPLQIGGSKSLRKIAAEKSPQKPPLPAAVGVVVTKNPAMSCATSHQCTKCDRRFGTKSLLVSHLRQHMTSYQCHVCLLKCSSNSSLSRHFRFKHFEERPFSCEVCGDCAAFKTYDVLARHYASKKHERRVRELEKAQQPGEAVEKGGAEQQEQEEEEEEVLLESGWKRIKGGRLTDDVTTASHSNDDDDDVDDDAIAGEGREDNEDSLEENEAGERDVTTLKRVCLRIKFDKTERKFVCPYNEFVANVRREWRAEGGAQHNEEEGCAFVSSDRRGMKIHFAKMHLPEKLRSANQARSERREQREQLGDAEEEEQEEEEAAEQHEEKENEVPHVESSSTSFKTVESSSGSSRHPLQLHQQNPPQSFGSFSHDAKTRTARTARTATAALFAFANQQEHHHWAARRQPTQMMMQQVQENSSNTNAVSKLMKRMQMRRQRRRSNTVSAAAALHKQAADAFLLSHFSGRLVRKSARAAKRAASQRLYQCHMCGERFKCGAQLSAHLIGQHQLERPRNQSRLIYQKFRDGLYRLKMFELAETATAPPPLAVASSNSPLLSSAGGDVTAAAAADMQVGPPNSASPEFRECTTSISAPHPSLQIFSHEQHHQPVEELQIQNDAQLDQLIVQPIILQQIQHIYQPISSTYLTATQTAPEVENLCFREEQEIRQQPDRAEAGALGMLAELRDIHPTFNINEEEVILSSADLSAL